MLPIVREYLKLKYAIRHKDQQLALANKWTTFPSTCSGNYVVDKVC